MSAQQTAAEQLVYTLMNYWGGELKRSGQRVDAKALEGVREQGRELVAEVERADAASALMEADNAVIVSEWWAEDVTNSAGNTCETVREWLGKRAGNYRRNEGENE